ncbi:MAG: phosphate--acyl-ACP acyltransferase, partial [Eubacteriales bacterium]
MRIIIDVMGADNAPGEIVRGAVMAKKEYDADITLVGNEKEITSALEELGESADSYSVVACDDFVSMEDAPMSIATVHQGASMVRALKMLAAGEGDAVISCGNTGALFTGATLFVRRVHGIRRAALATVLPYESSVLLLDCGANVTVTSEYLVQFAYLGSIYMEKVMGVKNPRVGLLNNGAESHKGTPMLVETHKMLEHA